MLLEFSEDLKTTRDEPMIIGHYNDQEIRKYIFWWPNGTKKLISKENEEFKYHLNIINKYEDMRMDQISLAINMIPQPRKKTILDDLKNYICGIISKPNIIEIKMIIHYQEKYLDLARKNCKTVPKIILAEKPFQFFDKLCPNGVNLIFYQSIKKKILSWKNEDNLVVTRLTYKWIKANRADVEYFMEKYGITMNFHTPESLSKIRKYTQLKMTKLVEEMHTIKF